MTRTILGAAGKALGVGLSTALTLAACGDGQTGSGYRGEPLMSLRGVVTSTSVALTGDLVPALSFISLDGLSYDSITTHYVKSEVEGTFPSSFTMRIYEPPPADILGALFDGEPAFTNGEIIAVSPEHPRWLRKQSLYEDIEEDGVVIGNAQRDELCSDTGECISALPSDCPLGQQDPHAEWPCGASFPSELPWETYGYSQTYSVVYFDDDVAAGSVLASYFVGGGSIGSGYHLVRFTDPSELQPEEVQERDECLVAAWTQAFDAANQIYGTHAVYPDQSELADVDQQVEVSRQVMIAQRDLGCRSLWNIVLDPGTESIELPFTDEPTRSTF